MVTHVVGQNAEHATALLQWVARERGRVGMEVLAGRRRSTGSVQASDVGGRNAGEAARAMPEAPGSRATRPSRYGAAQVLLT